MKNLEYSVRFTQSHTAPHPPHEEEHAFYDLVASGKSEEILRLREIHGQSPEPVETEKGVLSENPLRNAIYHLIVNCTIMTRRCIAAGMPQEEAYTLSDLFIRRADRCASVAEVHEINDEMALEFAARMKRLHSLRVSSKIKKTIGYICDHIYESLPVAELAKRIGYSRSRLSVLFRKETGFTLTQYIRIKKTEVAKNLIGGGTKLSEISQLLGFSSQSHFCKCFRDETGMTPSEYRRRTEENQAETP